MRWLRLFKIKYFRWLSIREALKAEALESEMKDSPAYATSLKDKPSALYKYAYHIQRSFQYEKKAIAEEEKPNE